VSVIGSIFFRLARSLGDLVGVTAEGRRLPTSKFFVGVRVSSRIALSRVKPAGDSLSPHHRNGRFRRAVGGDDRPLPHPWYSAYFLV